MEAMESIATQKTNPTTVYRLNSKKINLLARFKRPTLSESFSGNSTPLSRLTAFALFSTWQSVATHFSPLLQQIMMGKQQNLSMYPLNSRTKSETFQSSLTLTSRCKMHPARHPLSHSSFAIGMELAITPLVKARIATSTVQWAPSTRQLFIWMKRLLSMSIYAQSEGRSRI